MQTNTLTQADWNSLSRKTRRVGEAVLIHTLPNSEGRSDRELIEIGKELLFAGLIRLVGDGESIGIETVDVQ